MSGGRYLDNVGLALPGAYGASFSFGSDVAVSTSGSNVGFTSPPAARDAGSYRFHVVGVLFIALGATAPSALTVGAALAPTITVPAALLVANATIALPIGLSGFDTVLAGQQLGPAQVAVNPTGQGVTVKAGSVLNYTYERGAD